MSRLSLMTEVVFGITVFWNWPTFAQKTSDPMAVIPFCETGPVIDGKLSEGEWKTAAAITMFEAYPGRGYPRTLRQEQPRYFVCWDTDNLYVAMESLDSNTNTIVAACSMHDNKRIIGDDCMEFMVAPGAGEALKRFDFPTYYFAVNSIGTLWDAKFITLLNETHNSWESHAEIANSVDGTLWACEMRIPFASLTGKAPRPGQTWRMNLDRTFSGYHWLAWNAAGGLNDARIGGNITFVKKAPFVRLLSVDSLASGRFQCTLEAVNDSDKPATISLRLHAAGRPDTDHPLEEVGVDERAVELEPGKSREVILGKGQKLRALNHVVLEAREGTGHRLFYIERDVRVPAPRFVKTKARPVPLVYVFPRFLPSLERLAVIVDYSAWAKKTGYVGQAPVAEIQVFRKGGEKKPALAGQLQDFDQNRGAWRVSTKALPEGEYTVLVQVRAANGEIIAKHDDWFVKKIFDWMLHPRGVPKDVPAPYTALKVRGREVQPWGRVYGFTKSGLLEKVVSQGRELVMGPAKLHVEADGRNAALKTRKPFTFEQVTPGKVQGRSLLIGANLKIELHADIEYDGFIKYRMTYGPLSGETRLGRLRLELPMAAKYARFFSAAGDTQGTTIPAALLPTRQGKIFDSLTNTHSVTCSPTFCSLFWVGDHETCFCYAADNDKGWALRDDAPAVEVYRKGEALVWWLNLVDRPVLLKEPLSLEFAFQAGPLKPVPAGWRGIQDGGDSANAPLTIIQTGGGGHTLAGGTNFIHPGNTREQIEKSRQRIEKLLEGGRKAVVGYHYWATVPKGLPEARVFRGEWGIDKYTWDTARHVNTWMWKNRFFGENRDLYTLLYIQPVPSYVDFITFAYDEALKHTRLSGFYDDTGYPKPVYDEELGIGYVRPDGRKVYSTGLWLYRERWKRAAAVNAIHGRPNYLRDSQHVHAHFMPAYGFIGIYAPCERGFYNPFPDRDNLGFYGSVERYAAFNPARAFGQIPMVGMSSPQKMAPHLVHDTRSMMMMALLNDQDVGSFGQRDLRTVCKLRRARNLFRPWAREVKFTGYWNSKELVSANDPAILVSVWNAPGRALFAIGNTSKEPTDVQVKPHWRKLKLALQGTIVTDAETGKPVSRAESDPGQGYQLRVPGHDIRLVLVQTRKDVLAGPERLGAHLPRPTEILQQFSDNFAGPQLSPIWIKDLHEGGASADILDGRLCVQGAHYGFAHLGRKLGMDNVSAQCLILRKPTGGADDSGGSLFLYWKNGSYVQAVPGVNRGKFLYRVSGKTTFTGSEINRESPPGWFPYFSNWVRIELAPSEIRFFGSADGKSWHKDGVVNRPAALAGPPDSLLLGNGRAGKKPYLCNVVAKYFHPDSPRARPMTFFSDLIVGKP